MVTDTIAALKRIVEVGTRTETVRIGDAYSDTGWQTYEIVSEEAEIAAEALAALSAPVEDGEIEGLIAFVGDCVRVAEIAASDGFEFTGEDGKVYDTQELIYSQINGGDVDTIEEGDVTRTTVAALRSLSARLAETKAELERVYAWKQTAENLDRRKTVELVDAKATVRDLKTKLAEAERERDEWRSRAESSYGKGSDGEIYATHSKTLALQADLTAAIARAEKAERERDVHKRRGDNHWETLRGIRHIAREGGDLERIILWVNDAGRGYVETADKSLAQLADERNAAIAERDRLAGLVREAGEALRPFAEIVEKADERARKSGFAPSFDEYEVEWSFTFGELRTARALASRLKADGGANG